jgi:hypothetical protein
MPTDGQLPDGVKNAEVALRWRAFWRGRVDERLLERRSGREASREDGWTREYDVGPLG